MEKNAFLAALVGIDGAGKSTALRDLEQEPEFAAATFLAFRDDESVERVLRTRPDVGASDLLPGAALSERVVRAYAADFLTFYRRAVAPLLSRTILMISDRWSVCCAARAAFSDPLYDEIRSTLRRTVSADLLVFFDVSPAEATRRIAHRPPSSDESQELLEHFADGYAKALGDECSSIVSIPSGSERDVRDATVSAIRTAYARFSFERAVRQ